MMRTSIAALSRTLSAKTQYPKLQSILRLADALGPKHGSQVLGAYLRDLIPPAWQQTVQIQLNGRNIGLRESKAELRQSLIVLRRVSKAVESLKNQLQ